MIYLTLAQGHDRWEEDGRRYRLRTQGDFWRLAQLVSGDFFPVLRPEIAAWCFDNIGAFRLVEHVPAPAPGERVNVGPDQDDSWRIEFTTEADRARFQERWRQRTD